MKGRNATEMELSVIFSGVAVVLSLIFGFANWKRVNNADTKNDTTQLTTVIVKLETIKDGISEIKLDMKNIKGEIQELRERMVKNESAIGSAHKRLDAIEHSNERER